MGSVWDYLTNSTSDSRQITVRVSIIGIGYFVTKERAIAVQDRHYTIHYSRNGSSK